MGEFGHEMKLKYCKVSKYTNSKYALAYRNRVTAKDHHCGACTGIRHCHLDSSVEVDVLFPCGNIVKHQEFETVFCPQLICDISGTVVCSFEWLSCNNVNFFTNMFVNCCRLPYPGSDLPTLEYVILNASFFPVVVQRCLLNVCKSLFSRMLF